MNHLEHLTLNSAIKFKNLMLRSSLWDYSDAYILVSATITVLKIAAANNGKNIIIKNCAAFTNCISEINNTQIDNAKDIAIIMPMSDLIKYRDNYSKTFGSLWHYYRDGYENMFVCQTIFSTIKHHNARTEYFISWRSKGLDTTKLLPVNNDLLTKIRYFNGKIGLQFHSTPLFVDKSNYTTKISNV